MLTWTAFGANCLVTSLLGLYLGNRGLRGTFVDAPGPHRVGLLVFASLPVYLTLWLQETQGFTATPAQAIIAAMSFGAGLAVGMASRQHIRSMEGEPDHIVVERIGRARTASGLLVAAIGAMIGNRLQATTLGVDATPEIVAYACASLGLLIGWLSTPILVGTLAMVLRFDAKKSGKARAIEDADAWRVIVVLGLLAIFVLYRALTATNWTKGIIVFGLTILGAFLWSMAAARLGQNQDAPIPATAVFGRGLSLLKPVRMAHYQPGVPIAVGSISQEDLAALAEAVDHFGDARRLEQDRGPSGRRNAAIALKEQGVAFRLLGRLENARDCLLRAINEIKNVQAATASGGPQPPAAAPYLRKMEALQSDEAWCEVELGDVETLLGDHAAALAAADRAEALFGNDGNDDGQRELARLRRRL